MERIFKSDPISRNDIRKLTTKIRNLTGTESKLFFDIIRFTEIILHRIISDFEFEVACKEDMPNLCGVEYPAAHKIKIREDIYSKALKGDGFARFSIAHEVGHLFLNDISSISLCMIEPGKKLKAYEDPEWQADCFGGELLMYKPLIIDLFIEEISRYCGVTRHAAKIQKSKL